MPRPSRTRRRLLPHERHAVGDGGQRDEVEVGVGVGRVAPGAVKQRGGELVGDAGRAQVGARIAGQRRVDDGRVGQRAVGARLVVVGDDDGHPARARERDLVDGRDRAVRRDEQARAARGEALHRRGAQPVAVLAAARQVPVVVGPERAQGRARGSPSSRRRRRRSRRGR